MAGYSGQQFTFMIAALNVTITFNKVIHYVLAQHQYIIINSLVLAICFDFYQPSSGLCLLYRGTFSVHIHTITHLMTVSNSSV